nr:hypothetical protein [Entomoplasma sp. MP1]
MLLPKKRKEIFINVLNNNPITIIKYFEKANNQGMDFDVFTLSLIEIVKEIIEFKFTHVEILNVLDENDLIDFENVNVNALFEIADNLNWSIC